MDEYLTYERDGISDHRRKYGISINGTDTNDSPYKERKKERRKNGFLPQILQKNQ